jgi:hypothetical protein
VSAATSTSQDVDEKIPYPETPFLARALPLALLGLEVFPIDARGKEPVALGFLNRRGKPARLAFSRHATHQSEVIISKWGGPKFADCNAGVFFREANYGVDIDSLSKCEAILGRPLDLQGSRVNTSTADKLHLYFNGAPPDWCWTRGSKYKDDAGEDHELFSIRCDGRYVVGPGSIHPSGVVYAWATGAPNQLPPTNENLLRQLQEISEKLGAAKSEPVTPEKTLSPEKFDELLGIMRDNFEGMPPYEEREARHGGVNFIFEECVLGAHDEGDNTSQIGVRPDGVLTFHCFHGSHDLKWSEAKPLIEARYGTKFEFGDFYKGPTPVIGGQNDKRAGADHEGADSPKPAGADHQDTDSRSLEEKLAEMNERYCYVDETDIVVRLENMRMLDSSRFKDGGHLANRFHTTVTKRFDSKTGEMKPVVKKEKIAKLWLEWPKRRQVERLAYEPGKPRFFDGYINRWQGMGVEPIQSDVQPWRELLEKLIPDPTVRTWFEQWCAYPMQHFGTKLKSAVVMWSTLQGTGKTTVVTLLSRIYGANAVAINESDLHKPFNEWALDKQFVSANEMTGGDKRNFADFMKELIAGHEQLRINQKFLPEISIRNCINFLFTSNHPNSFYLEPSDRRYCIIEVPNVAPDRKFFDRYWAWLDNGGPAYLYHHLLNLPLEGFHPHGEPPMTDAKAEMIEISKSDLDRWLEEKREVAPNTIFTARELLNEYRSRHGSDSRVKESGMHTSLRRLGAVRKKVSIDGRKIPLWCLNRNFEQAPPSVWSTKYKNETPESRAVPF